MTAKRIDSRKNEKIKHIRKLGRDRSYRYSCREFVCDGEKLLREAAVSGAEILTVLCEEGFEDTLPRLPCAEVFAVPRHVLESASALKSTQSVVFTCSMRPASSEVTGPAILLDRLQDTGNMGTIIRTADAFGIAMIVEDGCADIYNPKTIRSAMGSLFRVPVISRDLTLAIDELRSGGGRVFSAELSPDAESLRSLDAAGASFVIGNEGAGVREEVSRLCDGSVIIPMRGGAESLNAAVAAAIFMYKMSQA